MTTRELEGVSAEDEEFSELRHRSKSGMATSSNTYLKPVNGV